MQTAIGNESNEGSMDARLPLISMTNMREPKWQPTDRFNYLSTPWVGPIRNANNHCQLASPVFVQMANQELRSN